MLSGRAWRLDDAAALRASSRLDSPRRAGASKMSMMFRSKADDDCSSSTAKLAAESLREGIGEDEGGVGRGGALREAGRRCERAERSG